MKKYLFIAPVFFALSLALVGCSSYGNNSNFSASTSPVATNSITINNFAFSPSVITVAVGSTVTITNNDSTAHRPLGDNADFDFGQLAPGQSASQPFSTAGTFTYHCTIHPSMTGTIEVK